MSDKIVLFDLPCRGRCASWSGNVWKARLVLNYKKIPYRTEWLTHAEIGPKLEEIGVAPNGGGAPYTVPTIILPDGQSIMGSLAIAEKLNALYPEPSLHITETLSAELTPIWMKTVRPLVPVFVPRVARDVLVESSVPFFLDERMKNIGLTLDDADNKPAIEKAWADAQPGFDDLSKYLIEQKKDEGPFVCGSQVSYVDFVLAAMLEGMRRTGQDIYDRMVQIDGKLGALHEACKPWMIDDQ